MGVLTLLALNDPVLIVFVVTVPVNVGEASGAAPVISVTGILALAVIAVVPVPFT